MQVWLVLVAIGCGACGRLGFDAHGDGGTTTGDGASGDDGSGMQVVPTFVQSIGCRPTAALTSACTFTNPVTAGNVAIVALDYMPGTIAVTSVTDNGGQPFALVGPYDSPQVRTYLALGAIPTSGTDTIVVTLDSVSSMELRITEFSHVASTSPIDTSASVTGTNTPPFEFSGLPLTTTATNELIFAFGFSQMTATSGPGYTSALDYMGDVCEFEIAPVPGTYTPVFEQLTGMRWVVMGAAFFHQ